MKLYTIKIFRRVLVENYSFKFGKRTYGKIGEISVRCHAVIGKKTGAGTCGIATFNIMDIVTDNQRFFSRNTPTFGNFPNWFRSN
jgi:hypothetical protein